MAAPSKAASVRGPAPLSFAFVFPAASGHMNPSLPVARALVALGHEVHFLCSELTRGPVEDTGATFHSHVENEPELYEGRVPDIFGAFESLKKEYGMEAAPMMEAWVKLTTLQLGMILPGLLRWLKRVRASVVFYDTLLNTEAAYGAKVLGIPSIGLLSTAGPGSTPRQMQELLSLSGMTQEDAWSMMESFEPHLQGVAELNARYGLKLRNRENFEPVGKFDVYRLSRVTLITTSDELQDPLPEELAEVYRREGARFEGVGPLLDDNGVLRCAAIKVGTEAEGAGGVGGVTEELMRRMRSAAAVGRPVVLASMGTVLTGDNPDFGWDGRPTGPDGKKRGLAGRDLCRAAWAGTFDAFGEANADDGALIIVSLGAQPDALGSIRAPANAVCLPVVPQVEVLRSGCRLFLTHGGQNSFMEAVAEGVPLVVCPGTGDQPINADRAVRLGLGLQVPRPDPDLGQEAAAAAAYRADVAQALRRVWSEASFREAAKGCSGRLQSLGGVPRAVAILVEAATAGGDAPAVGCQVQARGNGGCGKLMGLRCLPSLRVLWRSLCGVRVHKVRD